MSLSHRSAPVVGALAAVLAATAAPAHADPFGPPEATGVSFVTRLTLHDGAGHLTVQPRIRSGGYTGFEVRIPAGDGAWTAAPVVPVPDLGIVCVEDPGPDLHYRCGQTDGAFDGSYLPAGGYQVGFRVQHSGHPDGLLGTSSIDAITARDDDFTEYVGPLRPDAFPVQAAPHTRSTAEVGVAPLSPAGDGTGSGTAILDTQLTVVPGEAVTALDVALPPGVRWRITGTNAVRRGLQCFVRPAGPSLHCRPAAGRAAMPAGRYGLDVDLAYAADTAISDPTSSAPVSVLRLTVDGDAAASYDDFPWVVPQRY